MGLIDGIAIIINIYHTKRKRKKDGPPPQMKKGSFPGSCPHLYDIISFIIDIFPFLKSYHLLLQALILLCIIVINIREKYIFILRISSK